MTKNNNTNENGLYSFCESKDKKKDIWTCSDDYYAQLIVSLSKFNTINSFLSIIAILTPHAPQNL